MINLLTALFCLSGFVFGEEKQPPSLLLFKGGMADTVQFRIPSLLSTPKGTLIAMVDARRNRAGDIPNDVDIAIRRSLDGGRSWESVRYIADYSTPKDLKGPWGCADAAMVYDKKTKTIWAVYTMGQGVGIRQSQPGLDGRTCQIHAITSKDEGKTWSEPIDITPQCKRPSMKFFGTAPGVGIQTKDGSLVFAIYATEEGVKPMVAYLIISKDHGKSWKLSNAWGGVEKDTTETQIVELSDGSWMINSRNHFGKGRRLVSITKDQGKTWSEPHFDQTLTCPTCMASLISIPDPRDKKKNLLVFANPAGPRRRNGTVRISEDEGKTWRWSRLFKPGGYGYSCLAPLKDDVLGLFYESEGGEVRFARLTLDWVTADEIKTKGKMLPEIAKKSRKIICFGDSTTAFRRGRVEEVYSVRIEKALQNIKGFENIEVVNEGIGGSHTGSVKDHNRFRIKHALDRFESNVLNQNPELVVIQFGINDSYIDKGGEEGKSRISLTDYRKNLLSMVQRLKQNKIKVILMTPNPFGKNKELFRHERLGQYIDTVRKVAKESKVALLDVEKLYKQTANPSDYYLLDGVHPNDKGHAMLTDALEKVIVKMLKQK